MYRTLLATCGSAEEVLKDGIFISAAPHVASNVRYITFPLKLPNSAEPHVASNVRYIAFPLKLPNSAEPHVASNVRYIAFPLNRYIHSLYKQGAQNQTNDSGHF